MITLRPAHERGHADHGWLKTWYTFSFSDYYDPEHMGFRSLRVINDDTVAPGGGFPTHGHRDMEIVTCVLEGALEHKDSLGNGSVIRPGEVQRMTAGTGVTHSEFNPSPADRLHLLQIWILPERKGLAPEYEQKRVPDAAKNGRLALIASREGGGDAVTIHQDASIYAARLANGQSVRHELQEGRHAWVHVASGRATLNGRPLAAGDGARVSEEPEIHISGVESAEILLFDLG
jgi:redox-sensitive bicupin YhaK (pirin superfamily)